MTTPLAEAIRVLADALPGVHVGVKVPNPIPPNGCVRVSRVGGQRDRSVDHALIVVECFAPTSVEAESRVTEVDDILRGSPEVSRLISSWGGGTISDYPDPDYPGSRWQVVGTLHCITF